MIVDGEYIEPGTPMTNKQYRAEVRSQEKSARVLQKWNALFSKCMKLVEADKIKKEKINVLKKKKAKKAYDRKRTQRIWRKNYKDKEWKPVIKNPITKKMIKKSIFLQAAFKDDSIEEIEAFMAEQSLQT